MSEIVKEYSNDEITIVWKPAMCQHSATCFKGLKAVFDPRERPWVKINAAETEKIIKQINKCPSKALSFYNRNEAINN